MLLEAIIALGITTFLILCTTQLTRSAMRTLKEVVTLSGYMNKVINTTNQLEKDLSSLVVVPTPTKEASAEDKDADVKPHKFASRALIAQADEKLAHKIDKKEYLTFKILNGVTTSTLQSYGENKPHFVRFCYKLIKQTPPPPHQKKTAFKLFRRETTTIDDLNIKQDSEMKQEDMEKSTEWVLICNNIKDLVVEYSTLTVTTTDKSSDSTRASTEKAATEGQKSGPKDSKKQPEKPEVVTSFEWPNKKLPPELQEQTPLFITVTLLLWDDAFEKPTTYKKIIACLNHSGTLPEYALQQKQPDKKASSDAKALANKSSDAKIAVELTTKTPTTQNLPAQPPTPPAVVPTLARDTPPPPPRPEKPPRTTAEQRPTHKLAPGFADHEIPEEMKLMLDQLEHTELANIDPDKVLSQLPPEIARAVQLQMEEFERHPEKLYQSVMELFK